MPAPSTPPPLGGDEATLYERHRRDLLSVVRRRVNISEDLIEDACQHAWSMLLSTQPDRGPALFGWLLTVAVREGYRLSARETQTESLDSPAHGDHRFHTTAADRLPARTTIDDTLEARRALRALASLRLGNSDTRRSRSPATPTPRSPPPSTPPTRTSTSTSPGHMTSSGRPWSLPRDPVYAAARASASSRTRCPSRTLPIDSSAENRPSSFRRFPSACMWVLRTVEAALPESEAMSRSLRPSK